MKKLTFLILFFISVNVFSQSQEYNTLNCYVSGALSVPPSAVHNFKQNSYPSLEAGVCFDAINFGFENGTLNSSKESFDNKNDYYYEFLCYPQFQLWKFKGYAVAGYARYYSSDNFYFEYGIGTSQSIGRIDLCLELSYCGPVLYLSPGITYNFKVKTTKRVK